MKEHCIVGVAAVFLIEEIATLSELVVHELLLITPGQTRWFFTSATRFLKSSVLYSADVELYSSNDDLGV